MEADFVPWVPDPFFDEDGVVLPGREEEYDRGDYVAYSLPKLRRYWYPHILPH